MPQPSGNISSTWDNSLAAVKVESLRRFIALAGELNFTRTARQLHISQQVLSAQIKELERAVGVPLFDRSTHRVALTAAGREFLAASQAALSSLLHGLHASRATAGAATNRLRVGFIAQGGGAVQSEVLRQIRERRPELEIDLHSFTFTDPFAGLLAEESDVAFLPHPPTHPDVAMATLMAEPRAVFVPEDHPLAAYSELTASQLADLPAIVVRGHQSDPVIRAWVATHTLSDEAGPRPVGAVVETAEEWLQAALEGRGFTTIPASVLDFYRCPGVIGVPVRDVLPLRLTLGWRRGREADPVIRDVIDVVRQVARSRRPAPVGARAAGGEGDRE